MKRILSTLALLLALAVPSMALAVDAEVTFEEYNLGGLKLIVASWTGNNTAAANGTLEDNFSGEILGFRHVMGTGNGTAAITVKDASGLDILQGHGSGLVNGTVQVNGTEGSTSTFLPAVGPLTFQLDNFYTGGGTLYLWIR